ncbi:MAG TPA: hypothetical protein VMN36_02160 [Verrucomicrobiales bacterium]|nr:hypothetical protein [Verrucomicrobiales bacterium]
MQYLDRNEREDLNPSASQVVSRADAGQVPAVDLGSSPASTDWSRFPWHWCDDALILEYCTRELRKSTNPIGYLRYLLEQCPSHQLAAKIARHLAPLLPFEEIVSLAEELLRTDRILSNVLLMDSLESALRAHGSDVISTVSTMSPPLRSDWMPHALRVLARIRPLEAIPILLTSIGFMAGFNGKDLVKLSQPSSSPREASQRLSNPSFVGPRVSDSELFELLNPQASADSLRSIAKERPKYSIAVRRAAVARLLEMDPLATLQFLEEQTFPFTDADLRIIGENWLRRNPAALMLAQIGSLNSSSENK